MPRPASLLALSVMLAACSGSTGVESTATLPIVAGCFVTATSDKVGVELELAQTPQERGKGLMGRKSLKASSGMLFRYQETQSPKHGFWMYQTLLPLDIAYLDRQGVIANIRQMAPCESASGSGCPRYPAEVEFDSAVEMNAGFFKANNINIGDRLMLGAEDCGMP